MPFRWGSPLFTPQTLQECGESLKSSPEGQIRPRLPRRRWHPTTAGWIPEIVRGSTLLHVNMPFPVNYRISILHILKSFFYSIRLFRCSKPSHLINMHPFFRYHWTRYQLKYCYQHPHPEIILPLLNSQNSSPSSRKKKEKEKPHSSWNCIRWPRFTDSSLGGFSLLYLHFYSCDSRRRRRRHPAIWPSSTGPVSGPTANRDHGTIRQTRSISHTHHPILAVFLRGHKGTSGKCSWLGMFQ